MKPRIGIRDVLRALGPVPDIKAAVLDRFRTLGGNIDRWSPIDIRAMRDALTYGEDMLEVASPGRKAAERRELRIVRRNLESDD